MVTAAPLLPVCLSRGRGAGGDVASPSLSVKRVGSGGGSGEDLGDDLGVAPSCLKKLWLINRGWAQAPL